VLWTIQGGFYLEGGNGMLIELLEESSSYKIDLSDHHINDLDRLISFFYTRDYQENDTLHEDDRTVATTNTSTPEQPSKALTNATMYAIGDRYDMEALKSWP
jgi:hypothetical protein